jgi:hypothetical protein
VKAKDTISLFILASFSLIHHSVYPCVIEHKRSIYKGGIISASRETNGRAVKHRLSYSNFSPVVEVIHPLHRQLLQRTTWVVDNHVACARGQECAKREKKTAWKIWYPPSLILELRCTISAEDQESEVTITEFLVRDFQHDQTFIYSLVVGWILENPVAMREGIILLCQLLLNASWQRIYPPKP